MFYTVLYKDLTNSKKILPIQINSAWLELSLVFFLHSAINPQRNKDLPDFIMILFLFYY